jgi:hypothetical protein
MYTRSVTVVELPNFICPKCRPRENSVLDVCPTHAIDDPMVVDALKCERFGNIRLWGRWNISQRGWDRAIVATITRRVTYYEAHDQVCSSKVNVALYSASVLHSYVLAFKACEVYDNLITLAHGKSDETSFDRMREKS